MGMRKNKTCCRMDYVFTGQVIQAEPGLTLYALEDKTLSLLRLRVVAWGVHRFSLTSLSGATIDGPCSTCGDSLPTLLPALEAMAEIRTDGVAARISLLLATHQIVGLFSSTEDAAIAVREASAKLRKSKRA